MDTGRLLETLDLLVPELEDPGTAKLIGALQQAVAERSKDSIREILERLESALDRMPSNLLPPSRYRVVELVGGETLFGSALAARLKAIALEYYLRSDHAAASAGAVQNDINELRNRLTNAVRGLRAIGVVPHRVRDSKCELGVLYPRELVPDLDGLQREVDELDKHLRVILEIGGDRGRPRVISASDDSVDLFLEASEYAGLVLLAGLKLILKSMKDAREIELLGLQIKEKRLNLSVADEFRTGPARAKEAGLEQASRVIIEKARTEDPAR